MMDFIMSNFSAVAGVLLALILFAYALITRQWSLVKVAAYKFMLDAERLMRSAGGKEKMEVVFAKVWEKMPKWLKKFVSEKTLREKLQEWYVIAKNSIKE